MKTIRVVAAVIEAVDEQVKEILLATQRGYGDMKGGKMADKRRIGFC